MATNHHSSSTHMKSSLAILACALMLTITIVPARTTPQTAYVSETLTLTFDPTSLTRVTQDGYDYLAFPDAAYPTTPGVPYIPSRELTIAVPATATITSINILSTTTQQLSGTYTIPATIPPQTIGYTATPPTPCSPTPTSTVRISGEGDLYGQGLARIQFNPLQYNAITGTLTVTTSLTIQLTGTTGRQPGDYLPDNIPPVQRQEFLTQVQNMVINPEAVQLKTNPQPHPAGVPAGDYDYVIITQISWVSAFQPLADWKTQKGVPATIVTTDWIYNSGGYSGTNLNKIKSFVQDAYTTWGAIFFLLGGDTDTVPCSTKTFSSVDYDPVPNDVYYADFDADYVCEVNVGRASVTGTGTGNGKIGTFISKILTYEQNPPADYPKKAAMFGFDLDSITEAEQCKITIDNTYIPSSWTMTNVYDSNSGNHKVAAIAAMNAGQNLINHADHSNTDVMGIGYVNHNLLLETSDMDALTNGNKQSILYSMGCDPCAYDESNCIAEHFVRNQNGGGIAFIGNSRYGWYEYDTYDTLSMGFDQAFFHSLFTENYYRLGQAFSDHKNDEVTSDDYDRYIFTELTLLGDPELPVWTENTLTFTITHPSTLPLGPSSFAVHVTHSGTPVYQARVCLWKGTQVYLTGLTNSAGDAVFTPNPTTLGIMNVTVTKQNYLPNMTIATVINSSDIPPVAVNDTATTNEDAPVWVLVLANDYDPDGTIVPSSVIVTAPPAHAATSVNTTTGAIRYIPDTNYYGTDSFVYQVSDNQGAIDNATVTVTINEVNDPPVAFFTFTPVHPVVGETIFFNSSSFDVDGTLENWSWDFGDGTTGYGDRVTHVFYGIQTYSVTLTVLDDDGASGSFTMNIQVLPSPVSADAGGPYTGMAGTAILFSGNASGGVPPYLFEWDFGDGNTSTEQNPQHVYRETGTYTIHLYATDHLGEQAMDDTIATVSNDTIQPTISLVTPVENMLYIFNRPLIPLSRTIIIGSITVTVHAEDYESGMDHVEVYVNDALEGINATGPDYECAWTTPAFGMRTLRVVAYDLAGNSNEATLSVLKIL